MKNTNKHNNLTRVCAFVLLCMILLSFVFSVVALVKSFENDSDVVAMADEVDTNTYNNNISVGGNFLLPLSPAREFGLSHPHYGETVAGGGQNSGVLSTDMLMQYMQAILPLQYANETYSVRLNWLKNCRYTYEYATPLSMVFQSDCSTYLNSIGSGGSRDLIKPLTFDWYKHVSRDNSISHVSQVFGDPAYFEWSTYSAPVSANLYTAADDVYTFVFTEHFTINDFDSNGNYLYYQFDVPLVYGIKVTSYEDDLTDYNSAAEFSHLLYVSVSYLNNASFAISAFYANGYVLRMNCSMTLGTVSNTFLEGYSLSLLRMAYRDGTFDDNRNSTLNLKPIRSSQIMLSSPGMYSTIYYRVSYSDTDSFRSGYAAGESHVLANYQSIIDSQYDKGYQEAYDLFKNDYEVGYTQGHTAGFNEGKGLGIIEGAATANNYTFYGLISAVVDAPVQAFKGLLNFEFLGVNLLAFFTGLLTVVLIIFIIRKVLGK